jgi:hypothetical protein
VTCRQPWAERSIAIVSKDVSTTDSRKPVSFAHGVAMVVVGAIGLVIAFAVLSSVVGFFFELVKIVVIIGLIAGAFWVVSRLRR